MVFNLFGKRRSAQPSFTQQLETLYEGNDYQGILELSRKLVKEAGKLYPDHELKNKHLLPLLSNMARKLSEDPDHLDDAVTLSTQIISITLREPSKLAEEDTYHHYVDLQKVRDEESAFLWKVTQPEKRKCSVVEIYAPLLRYELGGSSVDASSVGDQEDVYGCEADPDDLYFQEVLDPEFDVLIRQARESRQPAAALVTLVVAKDRSYEWDKAVQKALAEELNKMSSGKEVLEFCVAQALRIPETKANMPTASYLIETVLDGVVKPELVPDRRAFEKNIARRTSSSCDALTRALDDLRRKEKDLESPRPTMHGARHFLARQRKLDGLHQ